MTISKNKTVARSNEAKRAKKASGKSNAPSSVPIATSSRRKQFKPRIQGTPNGVTVTHTEYLSPIVNTSVNGLAITSFRVQPLNAQLFPWLATISTSFDQYHFDYLKVSYNATCPSTTPGEILILYDPDNFDTTPTTVNAMLNSQYSADFAVWRSCGVEFPEHIISVPEKSLNITAPNKNIPSGIAYDVALSSGTLFIGTYSSAPLQTTFGRIAVSYRVKLINLNIPTISKRPGATDRVSTLSPYSCAANGTSAMVGSSPFGTKFLYNQFPGVPRLGTGVLPETNVYGSMWKPLTSFFPDNPAIDFVNLPGRSLATQESNLFLFDVGIHNLRIRFGTNNHTATVLSAVTANLTLPSNWNGVVYASNGVNIKTLLLRAVTNAGQTVPAILELDLVVIVEELVTNLGYWASSLPTEIQNQACSTLQLNIAGFLTSLTGSTAVSSFTIDYWTDVGDTFAFL